MKRFGRIRKLIFALAAAILLLLGACFLLRPSPMIPMKNDPREVAKIMAGMQKARAAIHNSRGKVYISETMRNPDGSRMDRQITYTMNFDGDRYKVIVKERRTQSEKAHLSLKQRLEQLLKRRFIAQHTTRSTVSAAYAFDGKHVTASRWGIATIASRASAPQAGAESIRADVRSWMSLLHPAGTVTSINGFPLPFSITYSNLQIVGRQVVKGADCVVVRQRVKHSNAESIYENAIWICPSKGYFVLQTKHWELPRGDELKKRLTAESTISTRHCGHNIWIPVTIDTVNYAPRGRRNFEYRSRTEFAPDFEVNVPKSRLDLKLKLPSGIEVRNEVTGKNYVVP